MNTSFIHKCINETLRGLQEGLTQFSGPSRVAVIFCLPGETKLSIYDPDSLLRGHELLIRNHHIRDNNQHHFQRYSGNSQKYNAIETAEEFNIDGLLSYGGCSSTVPYQMWFTEHHPDLSSTGPIRRWLQHTVLRFSHDIANKPDLYTGISGNFLKEYSTHAIHDHILKEAERLSGDKFRFDIYRTLEEIIAISKTREEQAFPYGELVFVPPENIINIKFMASFATTELPQLNHSKHVRKLLQTVEGTPHKLISDGSNILGISGSFPQGLFLTADYRGRFGYLTMNNEPICSFADGRYRSSSLKAKLYEVEEALLDYQLAPEERDNLFHIISTLVHNAQTMKHGCTFVLDLNDEPTLLSGQLLQKPLDLNNPELLDLSCALSRVDGALHIYRDQHLLSFACLLAGQTIEGEDRARGARYNSALRFTAENRDTIVIVVSSDRPVSVIQHGIVFHGHCQYHPPMICSRSPETLDDWLAVAD